MKEKVKYFHLRGAFDYNKLNWPHKFMMWMMKKMIEMKNPDKRSKDEQELLATFSEPSDFKSRENINPIVKAVAKIL